MAILIDNNGETIDTKKAIHDLAVSYAQIKLYEAIRKNEYGGDPFDNFEAKDKWPPKSLWEIEYLFDKYCSAYSLLNNFGDEAWKANLFFEEQPCDQEHQT